VNLFVYGTLRRGAAMHALLEGRVSYLGPARVAGRLIDLGAFPGLAAPVSDSQRVHGDLFSIRMSTRDALLGALDRYEGDSFNRVQAVVESPAGEVRAWLYRWCGDPSGCRIVAGGDYLRAFGGAGSG
jgi:gamma-glutamylcyclotransferase (GGCT)/AIG2-like uncharacterized protein YtfP